jgi:nucleoside-diphosphate kinase
MANNGTFVLIKPDAVERKLVGDIISRFEKKGFVLIDMRMIEPTREQVEEHYSEHKEKPFFDDLVAFMKSGPVVAMVWVGEDAIATGRALLVDIRKDMATSVRKNACHASDSPEAAVREHAIWFSRDRTSTSDQYAELIMKLQRHVVRDFERYAETKKDFEEYKRAHPPSEK